MDEMMTLVNGIGTSAAGVSNTLGEIGDVFNGIGDIYINALEFGEAIGYKKRLLEEPLKALENNTYTKVLIGGVCFLVGAAITVGSFWLAKRDRAKKKESNKQSEEFLDDTSFDKLETDFEQILEQ